MVFVFAPSIWFIILGSFSGVVITMHLFYQLDIVVSQIRNQLIIVCGLFTGVCWISVKTLCSENLYCFVINNLLVCFISAKPWSSRFFQLFWRLCVILLIATYTGGLVAALTTDRMSLPFKDLKGLSAAVSRDEYKFCTPSGTAFFAAVMII